MCNDAVHGHLDLHELSLAIMSTPEFQRLYFISQMGSARRVYPGATHSRGEHSIGVAHLASRLVSHLIANQPELRVTPEEALCVQLAGLCHDLGHGPFSHLFEKFSEESSGTKEIVPHEHMSYQVLTHIIETRGYAKLFYSFGLNEGHIRMIGEMMWGREGKAPDGWAWMGPPPGKEFLYEIVCNEETGIDVDKFDYYLRDCRGTNISISFDYKRLMRLTRALPVDGKVRLCYAVKDYWNVCEVFRTRFILFTRLYTHKTVVAADEVLLHLLRAMDKHSCPLAQWVKPGKDEATDEATNEATDEPGTMTLSEFLADPSYFVTLKDSVVELAMMEPYASDPEVQKWYKRWIGRSFLKLQEEQTLYDKAIVDKLMGEDPSLVCSTIGYGVRDRVSPLRSVYFYDKRGLVVPGDEVEEGLGALLKPPFHIYKLRNYSHPEDLP